ncbi:hypothetical protein EI94DRAFT_1768655 [Lactarius quietus]|nr:hypothetical protein EI94DRAFT_1768655 [Lactarius quietus]
MYHGVGALITIVHQKTDQIDQLHMSKLNGSRKLLAKVGTLDEHKQWVLAIASGEWTAWCHWFKRKGFTSQKGLCTRTSSIVLLHLGGVRVPQFAHQSLALLILPALVISPSTPTVAEVDSNILSCCSSFNSVSGACSGGNAPDSDLWQPLDKTQIMHQVLMLDELAVEKCVHLDDLHNNFQGTCREHNHKIPLDFMSERELNILCEAMQNDEVHLATEVMVAAIEYAVWPILFSGTCKKEMSEEHAHIIKTVLDACNKQKQRNNATYRTVCIRGDALVILAMTCELSADSLIYALLQPLKFLNLLVGPDDITADKDFKHIIKCQWNIFMCAKGVEILGFCITPAILHSQLEYNGISTHRLGSLLNPNDKQDMLLTFSLLREIWSFPPPPTSCDPAFALARYSLNIAAVHLMFLLYCHNLTSTWFMPRQSYLDINLMVKNAFFCVVKMKIDNPGTNFYLTFFGLIRTAVGTDANVDMVQLGSRASGLTEVIPILAEHPEWDYGTCHLSLPVFSKETLEFTSKADHISPKDWRSNLSVSNVNLHTCWLLGQKKAEELIPDAEAILRELMVNQHNDNSDKTKEVNEEGDAFNTSSHSEGCL